jgi:hypothetical protein
MKALKKTISGIVLFLLLTATVLNTNAQWIQIGNDIDGANAQDWSGNACSFNADGTILAIGAASNGSHVAAGGQVRVFENSGGDWIQLGSDIYGDSIGDWSGYSISLNSNGDILAVGEIYGDGVVVDAGRVRIFEYSNNSWNQLGNDIQGEFEFEEAGYSLSLSDDGHVVAVGFPYYMNTEAVGRVGVYELNGGSWVMKGDYIYGEQEFDNLSGWSVSLSANGNTVAIGAPNNDGNGNRSGHVRVYNFNNGNWEQIGQDIDGEDSMDRSGYSVSLNANGDIVAIGAPHNAGSSDTEGQVRVYQYDGSIWNQIGSDLDGDETGDRFGESISLNALGTVVAGGAASNDDVGQYAGHAKVYSYSGTEWIQVGDNIEAEAANDGAGRAVTLDNSGDIIAISSPGHFGSNGENSGHVRVFQNSASINISEQQISDLSIYPNPSNGLFRISGVKDGIIEIWSANGQLIRIVDCQSDQSLIELDNQSSGLYIAKVITIGEVHIQKFIIQK